MDAANAARTSGLRDQAIAHYTRAQRMDATQTLPVVALAGLAAEDGKLAEAERSYRQVLARESDNLDALRGLVNVMAQQGRIDDAEKLIREVLHRELVANTGGGNFAATLIAESRVLLKRISSGNSPFRSSGLRIFSR